MNDIVRDLFPSYFPTVTNDSLQKWVSSVEQLFKQPIKQVFPYPIDVKRVYSNTNGKLVKLVFEVALAGLSKEDIKVQLKKNQYLTIKVEKNEPTEAASDNEEVEYVYSSKALSHKDGEITFKIFNNVDVDKFKPTFVNGLLTVELYVKEPAIDEDVIEASIG